MKVLKSLFLCVGTVLLALNFTACTDWGDADPEAGNQTYPDRSVVNTYTFDYGADDVYLGDITDKADVCEAVEDADLGSNVLHLDANGYAVMANPFNGVKLQNGAAITFWLKTAGIPQEVAEGEEPAVEDDLTGAVLAFGSGEAGAERFYLTANGQLRYTKPGNLESLNLNENDPATYKTGILPAGGWHFVALQISEEGYQLYVDGNKSLSGATPSGVESTTFSYKTLIDFLNTAPNIYIGKGAGDDDVNMSEMWVDDVKFIRNQMIASDWAMPNKGGGGAGDNFEYIIGEPINEIGAPDCSSAWWTEWSNYFRIPANNTLHLQFVNHTSGGGNWNNWNLAITTDADRAAAGYVEYLVLRSDLYGWGDSYTLGTWTSVGYPTNDAEWTTYRQDMEGATVDIDIARAGNQVTMTAVAHCTNGKVYQESFSAPCGEESDVIRAFLAVDASYLVMNWDNCYVKENVNVSTIEVGNADNSTAWWGAFTDYFTIPVEKTLVLNFTNYGSGANAWNNWVAVVTTDAERDGAGYAEYFVLRSDNYGWGDASYNAANIGLVGYDGDWVSTFSQQMNGAQVEMTIERVGAEVNFAANATCTDEHVFTETYHQTCGDGTQAIRAFLTVDGSHYTMDPANCYLKVPLVK
ncbi:MAG: glucanase [Prevotella sp.]|nr:glucanase [Prevotella sp.]